MAQANATRPILPVNGGVTQVNVLMNLGVSDYNGPDRDRLPRQPASVRVAQLHALEGDEHDRARTATASRRTTRTSRRWAKPSADRACSISGIAP
ncbi:MAG: hypothetical protein U0163_16045 [Gemmatimonadaceae bacterium]